MGMEKYFQEIEEKTRVAYETAQIARSLGYDPEQRVDIPLARDMAERIEGLISAIKPEIVGKGLAKRIKELEKAYGTNDLRVALRIAEEVADQEFCSFENRREALETGIRVGLAYITLGIVSAPLEGFVELAVKHRLDGGNYLACYFAGPIRAAGGTAAAFTILIADYLRKKFGYDKFDPTYEETQRYVVELDDYHRAISRLQYYPTREEVEFLIQRIPIEVTGDPTTEREVSSYKDLKRVGTSRIRGGACLVLAEGIAQKANKLLKEIETWGGEFGLEDWIWLRDYIDLKKRVHSTKEMNGGLALKIRPDHKYIEEAVAGRPIFSYPMRSGGFRIRYGRSRISGLAATSLHPATMHILGDFIATGSQLRIERPGKSCAITVCDSIEPPMVKLKDGSVVRVKSEAHAREIKDKVEEIIFLGDILISYGDFLEQNHILIPSGYCEEWWIQEVERNSKANGIEIKVDPKKISYQDAVKISINLKVPLHPSFTFFWENINPGELLYLVDYLSKANISFEDELTIPYDQSLKRILELLCIPHSLEEKIRIEKRDALPFLYSLGYLPDRVWRVDEVRKLKEERKGILEILNRISKVKIRSKAKVYLGARLGRPEKAKMRKLKGRPQVLFPVGQEGGRMRDFIQALERGKVTAEVPILECPHCNRKTLYPKCEICGSQTIEWRICKRCGRHTKGEYHCGLRTLPYERREIDIQSYINIALQKLNAELPSLIKGVRGTSNRKRIPEPLEKGILRAIHGIYVNKDGTTRLDAIEVPITHFKPREIGTLIEKLRELGYERDVEGNPLENEDQIVELKPQDVILPDCKEWEGASFADELIKICNFIDDLLVRFYSLEPFYNVKEKEDLIGHLIIGLAPHTSAGVIGRIIGFSRTQGYFAHPYFHAGMRRNADGDESCVILLMDALLNFSRQYLPDKRGGRTMDAPLVLTVLLNPNEVDREVHNMDVVSRYPIEFYEATLEWKYPWEVKIERVADRLGKDEQYFNLRYTHEVEDINSGVRVSAYKTLVTMFDKVKKQMELAEQIRAVDKADVAKIVIEKHFLKDIKGNLRKYSRQEFRCLNCNTKFRRIPLIGRCVKCKGKLVLTVAEGTVSKYLAPSLMLAQKYELPPYLIQTLEIIKRRIESIFGREKEKQESLDKFMAAS
jgi:DNA polymerase II large subunit